MSQTERNRFSSFIGAMNSLLAVWGTGVNTAIWDPTAQRRDLRGELAFLDASTLPMLCPVHRASGVSV
jgi:hypothetical protein